MNNSHTKIYAAAGAQFCGYSLVRRLAAACLIGAAAMSAAHAGPGDRGRDAQRASQMQQREAFRAERTQAAPRDRGDQRQFDSREFEARAEQQRRELQQQEQNNAEAFRRSGRLTPDERRDLRRQINEAGNEIYPDRRRR